VISGLTDSSEKASRYAIYADELALFPKWRFARIHGLDCGQLSQNKLSDLRLRVSNEKS